MLLLTSTSDLLQVVTASTGTIHVHASYADFDGTDVTLGRLNTVISTATTTTVVGSPAASTSRNVKALHIANAHASSSMLVTLQHTDGSTVVELEKVTLLAGERISYREGVGMRVIDAAGMEKSAASQSPSGAATTGQIAAHSADTYYLGIPVTGRLMAGSWFRWVFGVTKGAAGTAQPVLTIRFGTAGTVADASRAAMTMSAQTAASDSGYITVEATFRTVGASAIIVGRVALAHQLATTGLNSTTTGFQLVQTVSSTFDSSVPESIIGLSVNPGTSGAWVVESVNLDAENLIPGT